MWAACAAMALLLRPVWLAGAAFAPPCLWHAWTGLPCPGCGSTRAFVRLLHADITGALALNPLATVAAVAFLGVGLVAPLWLAFGGRAASVPTRPRAEWIGAVASVFIANWAWLWASGV